MFSVFFVLNYSNYFAVFFITFIFIYLSINNLILKKLEIVYY